MSNKKSVTKKPAKKPVPQPKKPVVKKTATGKGSKTTQYLMVLGLLVLIFLVFSPSFTNGFINYDDDFYILKNPQIQHFDFSHIGPIFSFDFFGNQYAPIAFTALGFIYMIGKFEPIYYIVYGLLMHLTVTYLVFIFIRDLTNKFNVALLTAALFGLATIQVESVTWIAGMVKTVSYSIFFVGALITYLKYVRTGKIKFIIYTLLLFIGSCLCKEQAVALPLALLVLDLYLKRKIVSSKVILEKIPFFIVSVIFGIITLKATGSSKPISTTISFSFFDRIVYLSYSIDNYLGKMLIPYKMSLFYPYPSMKKLGIWQYLYPLIFVGILGLFVWAIRKKKTYIIFGGLFFMVSILFSLALQIIAVREVVMADRYLYISSIGFFFILAYGAFDISEKYKISSAVVYGFFGIYLAIIGYQTAQRTQVFKNTITATTDVLKNFPSKLAYLNRGYEYKHSGQIDKALSDYNNALLIDSTYALAYRNRGVIYFEKKNDQLALRDYSKSIKYDSTVAESYANRGACYSRMGMTNLALKDFDKALKLEPDHKSALNNRSLTYFNMKEYKKAIEDLDHYLKVYPDEAASINLRGLCKINLKDYEGALADYNKSIQIEPNNGAFYQNRSVLNFQLKDKTAALKDAQQAEKLGVKMDPNYLKALQ